MKINFYILLLSAVCLSACNQSEKQPVVKQKKEASIDYRSMGFEDLRKASVLQDILCQTWDYKEDVADAKDLGVTSDLEVVYRGYSFFKDGAVTKDPRGNLQIANWHVDESKKPIAIVLEFADGKKESSKLAYLMPYEMILATGDGTEKKTYDLSAEAIRHSNIKDDPFYRDNVLWRIKPAAPETDRAIQQRLQDCIHFFVLFYDQQINSNSKKVTFIGLPSCFNWHAGGIFLQKSNELQRKWVNCFYNREQAMKAYRLAEKLMNHKYEWPKKGNWLELNVAVLKQMERKLVENL